MNNGRPSSCGIGLDVYVRRSGVDKGGVTSSFDHVVLVGTVDFANPTVAPTVKPLPPEYRFDLSSPTLPGVWLVMGRFGMGDRYLVPGRPEGGPDLSRQLKNGENFASTTNPAFWLLVGGEGFGAVRIFDRLLQEPDQLRQMNIA